MVALVVDLCAPDDADRRQWAALARARARRLPGRPFGYFTRRGARLVWRLPNAIRVRSLDEARRWSAWYRRVLVEVVALSGLVGDLTCADPLQLYRAPHTRREGERSADALGWLVGHPVELGELPSLDVAGVRRRATIDTLVETFPQWRRVLLGTRAKAS